MDNIKILHIGDIHYPQSDADRFIVDRADSGTPQGWVEQFSPDRIKQVSEAIVGLAGRVKAILFSGDLTSRGQMVGYRKCAEYLRNALHLDDASLWDPDSIHVVPGNHDVVRGLAEISEDKRFDRFEPPRKAWEENNLPVLNPGGVRQSTVGSGSGYVDIYSLNSCIGCGDTRHIPEKIRTKLIEILNPFFTNLEEEDIFELLAEQLDTPAVLDSHVKLIEDNIKGLRENHLPVILGHHGILPQARPRIEVYSEMLNGGALRQRLTSLDKPILYCHGHIHHRAVELVSQPNYSHGRLVSIAAPLYQEGFNLLSLSFQKDTGIPLGCEVIEHRMEEFGGVRERTATRIPLRTVGPAETLQDRIGQTTLKILHQTSPIRFDELKKKWPSASTPIPRPETLGDRLLELEWMGLISIMNRGEKKGEWIITSSGGRP